MSLERRKGNFSGLRPDDIPHGPLPEIEAMGSLISWIKNIDKPSLRDHDKFLKKLDIAIDISPFGVFVGGLTVSALGAVRRNSTIIQRGLGIAAAGLVLLNVDNPAQVVVETEIANIEDIDLNYKGS